MGGWSAFLESAKSEEVIQILTAIKYSKFNGFKKFKIFVPKNSDLKKMHEKLNLRKSSSPIWHEKWCSSAETLFICFLTSLAIIYVNSFETSLNYTRLYIYTKQKQA